MTDTAVPSQSSVSVPRAALAVAVIAVLAAWAWSLYGDDSASRALSFSLLAGTAFGITLQRGRFCFFCNFRDFLEERDPRGLLSILVALGVGFVLYLVVFLAWVPVPQADRLPPTAHVGPASPVLALAAFVFGVGMAISRSCISAHLYRLGEGSPTAPFALIGTALGFVAGFLTWNPLYLSVISNWPSIWLPHWLGYAGTLIVTLAVLGALALVVLWSGRLQPVAQAASPSLRSVLCGIFVKRWPGVLTGAVVGVIAMAAYFRVAPLGVTAEIGSLARTGASDLGLLPETSRPRYAPRLCHRGQDCDPVQQRRLRHRAGRGSFAAALVAGEFRPAVPRAQVVRGLVGGVLMGWGAMIGLGCTVGVLSLASTPARSPAGSS